MQVHSLNDYKDNIKAIDSNPKKKPTKTYAGGKSSGMSIENPFNGLSGISNQSKPKMKDNNRNVDHNEALIEKKYVAFAGRGRTVGRVNLAGLHINKYAMNNVNKTKPTCKVNFRLYNGQMIVKDFNLTQTLRELKEFVAKASGSRNFQLLEGFPPKVLNQFNKTIEELQLQETTLTQKLN